MSAGKKPAAGEEWRTRAESRVNALDVPPVEPFEPLQMAKMIHEMRVRQVELEMQNDELIQVRSDLESGAKLMKELYDFAPVGYFSISANGLIKRLNLKGAQMLGMKRTLLSGRVFGEFVAIENREVFSRFLSQTFAGKESAPCEVRLLKADQSPLIVSLSGTASDCGQFCRIAAMDVTETRSMEATARQRAVDLDRIFDLAKDLLAIGGMDGRFRRVNPAFERILGYSPEVMMSRELITFVHPDDQEATHEAMRALSQGEPVIDFVNRYRCADGSYVWLEWRAIPYGDQLMCCLARDVTRRQNAENSLRESEERLRLFITHTPIPVAMFDREMCYIAASDSWKHDHGFKEDVYGLCHYDLLPGMPDSWRVAHRRGLSGETLSQNEDFFIRADGLPCWVKWDLRPWFTTDGEVGGILICSEDITEWKASEDALRRSEKKFRSIVESSPTPMYLYQLEDDGRLILVDANEASDRELGIDHAGLIGKPLEEAFPGLADTNLPGMYVSVAKGELGIQRFESGYEEGGISGYYDVTVFQTSPGTIAVAFVDISERKKTQVALEKNQEALETRVEKRTEQLKARTTQLRALAADLSHAEEREQRRIAGLIHEDLQQNLVAALLNLGLLKPKLAGQDAMDECGHIEGILRDSLKTARSLTAELSPPVLQQCGLAAAFNWFRTWCDEKYSMDVKVDVEEGLDPDLEASVSLFRCVRELLFNIVKHAGVSEAALRMWRPNDNLLKIEVSDEGCGFDPDEVRSREGTVGGFGLFSIRERLEWWGGGFEIESSPGKGSRFTLWLPLKISESVLKQGAPD